MNRMTPAPKWRLNPMEMNRREPLWRIPAAILLFLFTLPTGFTLTFWGLMSLYPDAGAGAMIFLPLAALGALIIAGLTTWAFLLLMKVRWWAGAILAAFSLLGLAGVVYPMVSMVASSEIQEALKPYCEVLNPKPGQDLGNCAPVYTVPAELNPAETLFRRYGWRVAVGHERILTLPEKPDSRWQLWEAFSKDAKLDLTPYRGQEVRIISFGVEGAPLPGPDDRECRPQGNAVLRNDRDLVGAWIECRGSGGGPSAEVPGYSVSRLSVQQVTGMTWRQFRSR